MQLDSSHINDITLLEWQAMDHSSSTKSFLLTERTLARLISEEIDRLSLEEMTAPARQSLVGRITDRFRAALNSRRKTLPSPGSVATTIPDDARTSIPAPPANDPFYKKIMNGALAIVLERPEIIDKVWGVKGKENQYAFFRMIYDTQTRQTAMRRLLNGFKHLFCGENSLDRSEWIKVLNVANQLATDKIIPATLMNKMVKLYQYQVQGKKTPENVAAIHDVCLDEQRHAINLGELIW